MNLSIIAKLARSLPLSICLLCTTSGFASAQNSSLFQRPVVTPVRQTQEVTVEQIGAPGSRQTLATGNGNGMANSIPTEVLPAGAWDAAAPATGLNSSFTYMAPVPARRLKIHDIVSIRVQETAQSLALGNATSRKNTSYDAVLEEWVQLDGWDTLKPSPQEDGNPRIKGTQNEVYRGDSTIRTSESLTFDIAAEIVDIRPNGTIVLSARKTVSHNDNTWEAALSGICRSDDIGPDNVILSRKIHELSISKNDRGHVRDGYSRGWLTKFIARIKPF